MTLFFYGPNTYALRQQLAQMIEAYRAKAGSDFGLERIDGGAAKWTDLKGALQATPFLASSRLVIVEGLATNKAIGERLPEILKDVPATTVAVFVEPQIDQRTGVFRALKQADKVVKFEPLAGPKLATWVAAEAQRLGGSIDRAATHELLELAGEDQWRLAGEINKLVNYNPAITAQTVREMVVPSVERSIFDLVEAMTAARISVALTGYHDLLRQKQSEIYILTMIQWQLRNLLLAKTAPMAMNPPELAQVAGMSPYVAGKMLGLVSKLPVQALAGAYKLAADCEFDIKTGQLRAEAAVEQLIYRVTAGVGQA